MAVNMILDLGGDCKGESKLDGFTDKIDIYSFSWGLSNAAAGHTGGGSAAGLANVNDLTLTKYTDLSTNVLIQYAYNGKHIDNGTLHVFKAGGDQKVEYLKYEMDEVYVTNFSQSDSSGGGDIATESVTLNFSKVKLTYTLQSATGAGDTTPNVTLDLKAKTAQV
ncbi:MAG TPA: type VI secretion system tube protein Hcp [Blastocatellia bacterium]|jgi:type VI secretion system secreted protein Hcp|nr:type VI secretion system tube protein Hcp [Blastocatellia bacterium]